MFLKIFILVVAIAVVWFGFRAWERRDRAAQGDRKTGQRTIGERLRKSMREKTGSGPDPDAIEDTERCPTCGAFVSVDGISNCGKPKCPY